MSIIWDTLIELKNYFENSLTKDGQSVEESEMKNFERDWWNNLVWKSSIYRRAHLEIIDARNAKGMWILHCCIFPHTDNPAPIFGFDIIAGKNKITGCFHDFSPAGDSNHSLVIWFGKEVSNYNWKKPRELPDWGKRIFSEHMIAVGNVQKEQELYQIKNLVQKTLDHYLMNVGKTRNQTISTKDQQNYYAKNQKMNLHTPRFLVSLGLSEEKANTFVQQCLFPEI